MAFRRSSASLAKALALAVTRSNVVSRPALVAQSAEVARTAACWTISRGFAAGHSPSKLSPEEVEKVVVTEYEHVTGIEKEEVEGIVSGVPRFETGPPVGPFGTEESPAVIESIEEVRLVGCSGGYGEDEHDVVWFPLKNGQKYTCPDCAQVFKMKLIAPRGHH